MAGSVCGLGAEHDGVAECVEAADQALGGAMLVDAVKVIGAAVGEEGRAARAALLAAAAAAGVGDRLSLPGPVADATTVLCATVKAALFVLMRVRSRPRQGQTVLRCRALALAG